MSERKKCVGYLRVSTVAQMDGSSPEVQEEQIKKYVEFVGGYDLIQIYRDLGISGMRADRPAFQQLMEDARAHLFDMVIVSKFSRFGRSLAITIKALDELQALGIRFASRHENYDSGNDSTTAQLIRNILMSLAQWERDQITEQMRSGKFYRWSAKKIWVGGVPYGYQFNKEKGELEAIPEKLEIYKRIVSMYLDENLSFNQVLERLQADGIKCKDRPFSKPVLAILLKSTAYKGFYIANQKKYVNRKRSRTELNPEENWIRWECEPAISEERWEAIQSRIQSNRHKTKRRERFEGAWLRDSLICEICGSPVKPKAPARRDKLPTAYYCYWAKSPASELKLTGRKRCPLPKIDADELHSAVWSRVCARHFQFPQNLERLVKQTGARSQEKNLKAQLKTLQTALTKKENTRDNLMAMLEMDSMTPGARATFIRRMGQAETEVAELATKVQGVMAELGNIATSQQEARDALAVVQSKKHAIKQILRNIWNATDQQKYNIIKEMQNEPLVIFPNEDPPGWGVDPGSYQLKFPTKSILDFTNGLSSNKIGNKELLVRLRWRCRRR
jgi:DNA invertase Pin-like site-specific DNA recombinase